MARLLMPPMALMLAFFAYIVSVSPRAMAADCQPNNVRGVAAPGRLMISEFAVNRSFNACPTTGFERQIQVRDGRPLYVWLRLEGDRKFANQARPASSFMIRLHRTDALRGHWTWLDLINKKLGIEEVRGEASLPGNNGFFDWRLYAQINTYLVPGRYELFVRFGDSEVCPVEGACEIALDIKGK
ncbi:hypothetical protein GGE16_001501 [Rhizobium leguminosarum]|uniref:Uncharacterized protein n=1 Tax=Rhizobium leguminosarum TaxID=384 RepID=A0AAE2MI13_RHILE|nr:MULTISPECIES: hypothetical protein [Rhizobium]MBB4289485.1 hypothetical protein [Rhizobium leguminosarum]MBB4294419.1 hypothetical protein [Rhizobium leguminosarum]MBB4305815.1 hypothetical protein [Rhizobium leguminosarum]MBB4418608.1 hypothetical protein [Rhizobium leguminosarum]MBB4433452.1 hypothetical protein [Rhizobium esperanzae]